MQRRVVIDGMSFALNTVLSLVPPEFAVEELWYVLNNTFQSSGNYNINGRTITLAEVLAEQMYALLYQPCNLPDGSYIFKLHLPVPVAAGETCLGAYKEAVKMLNQMVHDRTKERGHHWKMEDTVEEPLAWIAKLLSQEDLGVADQIFTKKRKSVLFVVAGVGASKMDVSVVRANREKDGHVNLEIEFCTRSLLAGAVQTCLVMGASMRNRAERDATCRRLFVGSRSDYEKALLEEQASGSMTWRGGGCLRPLIYSRQVHAVSSPWY